MGRGGDASFARLSVLAALPVVALVVLGALAIRGALASAAGEADNAELAALDARLALTIAAVRDERGVTLLESSGTAADGSADEARRTTDAQLDALADEVAGTPQLARDVVAEATASLPERLTAARSLRDRDEQFDAYNAMVDGLLRVAAEAAAATDDAAMLRTMTGLSRLQEFGDVAGQERALLARRIASGRPMTAFEQEQWDELVAREERALSRAAAVSPALRGPLGAATAGAPFTAFDDARARVRDASSDGSYPIDASAWFTLASDRLDAVRSIADGVREELSAEALDDENDARARAWLVASGLAALVIGAVALQMGLLREVRTRRMAQARSDALVAEVQTTLRELATANADLERFAFVTAHDVQSSLRQAASFAELYDRELAAQAVEPSPRAAEFRGYERHALERMDELLGDILTFTSLPGDGPTMTDVDLDALLDDVLTELRPSIPAEASIVVDDLPTVRGDERLLRLALHHLLDNAVKYRRPGVDLEVSVDAARGDGGWEVRVHDNGIGIDAAYRARIFQLFQRLHGPDAYEGTGLGLAICARVAHLHGGTVEVTSTPGEGSTFTLVVPAVDASPAPGAAG